MNVHDLDKNRDTYVKTTADQYPVLPTELDPVNHPSHYIRGGIECLDVIEAWDLDYCLGNVVKYVCRAGYKSPDKLEDLRKAEVYLKRAIAAAEKNKG